MSKPKHTPGPWVVSKCPIDQELMISTYESPNYLASTFKYGFEDEVEANARLIAAAPELLEVAKSAAGFVASSYKDIDQQLGEADEKTVLLDAISKLLENLCAAIVKAEGS